MNTKAARCCSKKDGQGCQPTSTQSDPFLAMRSASSSDAASVC